MNLKQEPGGVLGFCFVCVCWGQEGVKKEPPHKGWREREALPGLITRHIFPGSEILYSIGWHPGIDNRRIFHVLVRQHTFELLKWIFS